MGKLAPYIPVKNAGLLSWSLNFTTLLTAAPATYGLTAGDATACAAQYTTLSAAYALITSPSTKTAATVSAFNTAKINALAVLRPYAQTISLNAGVSPTNKTAIGVNPRTGVPLPITTPLTFPNLTAVSTSTAGTILRYRDSLASPSVKSKPYGSIAVQVFAMVSATPITDPNTLTYQGNQTKSPFTLAMGSGASGKTVYFAARYVTQKGLIGPWSPIINYVVAG
jgi:hypothetical protein